MKNIKTITLLLIAATAVFACKKTTSKDPDCETNSTSRIKFKNTTAGVLRIEMAATFNAKFEPVEPVFVFDLQPGDSSTRDFKYGRYFIQWKANCATSCTQVSFYAKTFEQCEQYTEKQ